MGTACNKEIGNADHALRVRKNGRNHRDIGQVRTTLIGIVRNETVARKHFWKLHEHAADGFTHGPKMDWNMGCIGNEVSIRSKHSAAKIASVLDVDANRGLLQHDPHLICDRCDALSQYLAKNRIDRFGNRSLGSFWCKFFHCIDSSKRKSVIGQNSCSPTFFKGGCAAARNNQCGAV